MVTIFCKKDGFWRKKFEEQLSKNPMERVTLLALGRAKMEVLEYLNKHKDLSIIKMEARYMKNREKGLGLKIQIIKKQPKMINHGNHSFKKSNIAAHQRNRKE